MITQVSIKGLRGIAEGKVTALTPLTILTGVNGSGKSTILDALLIAAASQPGNVFGQIVRRRASRQFTAEWLFRQKKAAASVSIRFSNQGTRATDLAWLNTDGAQSHLGWAAKTPARLLGGIVGVFNRHGQQQSSAAIFADNGETITRHTYEVASVDAAVRTEVRLIDMRGVAGEQRDLTEVLSDAKLAGFGVSTVQLLSKIVPGIANLEILKVGDGYEVGVIFENGAVPLSMAGDGVRSVARLALELGALPSGLALLEEPEVHQHPGALKQSARTIVAAVKRGLQVVVATHSLELIDELLLSATESEVLGNLSVQKLRLLNGQLQATVFSGAEAEKIRNEIGTELR